MFGKPKSVVYEIGRAQPESTRPTRWVQEVLQAIDIEHVNPGIDEHHLLRLAGLAADLVIQDYDKAVEAEQLARREAFLGRGTNGPTIATFLQEVR